MHFSREGYKVFTVKYSVATTVHHFIKLEQNLIKFHIGESRFSFVEKFNQMGTKSIQQLQRWGYFCLLEFLLRLFECWSIHCTPWDHQDADLKISLKYDIICLELLLRQKRLKIPHKPLQTLSFLLFDARKAEKWKLSEINSNQGQMHQIFKWGNFEEWIKSVQLVEMGQAAMASSIGNLEKEKQSKKLTNQGNQAI